MTAASKTLVKRYFDELFNQRSLEKVDEIVATDYIEHAVAPFGHGEPGHVIGPDIMRQTVPWLIDQYPDLTMTIEALVTEGDIVVARVLSQGTNLGKLNGLMPPTGRRFSARQTHWFRVEDGRLAEHWATRDDLPAMIQLGVIQAPGRPTAT